MTIEKLRHRHMYKKIMNIKKIKMLLKNENI